MTGADTSEWVVIAFPTIMSGLVLRWYPTVAAAEARRGSEALSASREQVLTRAVDIPDAIRAAAQEAYELLAANYQRNYDRVAAMATHRVKHFLGSDIEPIERADSA